MVESRTRKREDEANHYERLGLKRISYASQLTISDTAGTCSDPPCNDTHTCSFQPSQPSPTVDIIQPLISSTMFASSTTISLFLIHNSTIISEHKAQWCLSISQHHDLELTPSTANTIYSIHPWLLVVSSFSRSPYEPWMKLLLPMCLLTWSTAIIQLPMTDHSQSRPVTFSQ